MNSFLPKGLPVLIGSLPMKNHREATELIFEYTPEIPLWPQLPMYPKESMMDQFNDGLPGLVVKSDGFYLDATKSGFDEEYLEFFEQYLAVSEGRSAFDNSVFPFSEDAGKGFKAFLDYFDTSDRTCNALKGQITGPVTFGTGVKDQDGRDVFYNEQLRDAVVKKLAMNAKWQAKCFAKRDKQPIVFIDEPSLAGFGTSAYITITREDVTAAIGEITDAIHDESGLAGVHVCANTEWDLLLESGIDVISFDAYAYFDNFILYPDQIKAYLQRNSLLAWGIVPTLNKEDIQKENVDSLFTKFITQVEKAEEKGIEKKTLLERIFISPSCGTGSISFDMAKKVLGLTRDLSLRVREHYFG